MPRAGNVTATPIVFCCCSDGRSRSYSTSASKNGPVASPAAFHHVAVASSATATKAPPSPCARIPTLSYNCADAGVAAASSPTVHKQRKKVRIGPLTLADAGQQDEGGSWTGVDRGGSPLSPDCMRGLRGWTRRGRAPNE